METQTAKKKYGRSVASRWIAKCELTELARRVIAYTQKSENAKLELLFSLPGIFAMTICFRGEKVRLIKEGDVFRFMEKSEKSNILLDVRVEDPFALRKMTEGKMTINQCAAQGRVTFSGVTKFFCVFTRICNHGDAAILSDARYKKLYHAAKQEIL